MCEILENIKPYNDLTQISGDLGLVGDERGGRNYRGAQESFGLMNMFLILVERKNTEFNEDMTSAPAKVNDSAVPSTLCGCLPACFR